jgi:hypothetical protein
MLLFPMKAWERIAVADFANQQPLALHVPEPKARPGAEPDWSGLTLPPAGAQPRPDETLRGRRNLAAVHRPDPRAG